MGRQILSQEGHEVETASNGDEALAWLNDHQPQLVMLDTRMPGPSGYEVCQRIKESDRWRSIKVVLLAGPLEPFDSDQADRVGSDAVLHKPLDAFSLIETVQSLIGPAERAKAAPAAPPAPPAPAPSVAESAPAESAPEPAPAPHQTAAAELDPFDELVKMALQQEAPGLILEEDKVRGAVAEVLEAALPTLVETISERILARLREQR